jgi:tetratricopeptide (TPR) repeat protein
LITSRREESWLDCNYTLMNLQGLNGADAQEFAAKILQSAGVDRKNLQEEYLDLLKLLDGHPLSLRVVLPHLKTQAPSQLIEGWRRGLDNLEKKTEIGRDNSLTASLDYSFSKLSEKARRHLPFLGLFCERVNFNLLSSFSNGLDADKDNLLGFRQIYQVVFGENLQKEDWFDILNEAVNAGILEHLGQGICQIHPVLPWYLKQQLSKHDAIQVGELENNLLLLYSINAAAYDPEENNNSQEAILFFLCEEPNLLQSLRFAQQRQDWNASAIILRNLGQVYNQQGFITEFRVLREKAFKCIGRKLEKVKAKGKSAFEFWIYLMGAEAFEAVQRRELDQAELIHQEILDELILLNDACWDNEIAVAYANLGMIAREKSNFAVAFDNYHKALRMFEDHEKYYKAAGVYYELGILNQIQWNFESSIYYLEHALKIYEENHDLYRIAGVYQQLGIIKRRQIQYSDAIYYLKKSAVLMEEIADYYFAAGVYHELGQVAKAQKDLEVAYNYFYTALQIYEDTEDWYNASDEYQSLGELAKIQKNYDNAIAYFTKAFDVRVTVKDWQKVTETLIEWGETLEFQGKLNEALKIYIQALEVDTQYNSNKVGAKEWILSDIKNLDRMQNLLGVTKFKEIWQETRRKDCPE